MIQNYWSDVFSESLKTKSSIKYLVLKILISRDTSCVKKDEVQTIMPNKLHLLSITQSLDKISNHNNLIMS